MLYIYLFSLLLFLPILYHKSQNEGSYSKNIYNTNNYIYFLKFTFLYR